MFFSQEGGDDPMDPEDHIFSPNESHPETQSNNSIPTPPPQEQEGKSMESTNTNTREALPLRPQLSQQPSYPMLYPGYFSPFFPFAFPIWMGPTNSHEAPQVLKPTALHSKNLINVDELVGMSNLSLAESVAKDSGGHLSLSLTPPLQGSSRQSAFHARPVSGGSASSPVPAAL